MYLISVNVTEISDKVPAQEGESICLILQTQSGFQLDVSHWYQLSIGQVML